MQAVDFSRSYMTFRVSAPHNVARIVLDASCEFLDEESGDRETFYLITPCKAEVMYQDGPLFRVPNYDFCGVWSHGQYLIMRTHASHAADNREAGLNKDRFDEVRIDLAHFAHADLLETDDEVVQATLAGQRLQATTHLVDAERRLRATLEYPVKTMNVAPDSGRFQVDTGPLAWPDMTADVAQAVERFSRAFVVYNRRDRAEFVIERPTPLGAHHEPNLATAHYSQVQVVDAENRLYRVS